jgi:hypothetical protein
MARIYQFPDSISLGCGDGKGYAFCGLSRIFVILDASLKEI